MHLLMANVKGRDVYGDAFLGDFAVAGDACAAAP